jgi:O-acetyl-ADP-ribose deacetylase (regulator of RNase III)
MNVNGTNIILKLGDITKESVDVIVNAANSGLLGGGGVDGAIHRAGGLAILEACKAIRKEHGICPPGNAVITTAGELAAKFVVHTVGPKWKGGDKGESSILRNAYLNSLELAGQKGAASIAFPAISTGVYGYPVVEAAKVALCACRDFALSDDRIKDIRLLLFSEADLECYTQALVEFD